jgi:hypothetical protein
VGGFCGHQPQGRTRGGQGDVGRLRARSPSEPRRPAPPCPQRCLPGEPFSSGVHTQTDGRLRPLGIATLEDKILQRAVVEVLNAIYEEDFLGFSYGFRPGRSPHDALDALSVGISRKKVNYVLDADISDFFLGPPAGSRGRRPCSAARPGRRDSGLAQPPCATGTGPRRDQRPGPQPRPGRPPPRRG